MFKILDGRTEFYQWDLERKLVVADSTIKQVHFCNRFGNCSLIRATYEVNGVTLVDVPNIILQDSFNLHCYGYDVNYTKFESVFNIVPRTKPENYINTEEELKVWDELEQKVLDLENKVDGEGIQAAVKQYLIDNPPQAGATTEEAAQIAQNKEDIAQLRQEFDNFEIPEIPEIPEVNLDGYATEKYVDDAVGAIDIPDVSGYVRQSYVDGKCMAVQKMIPSIEGLATEEYVDEAIANIDIPEGGGGTVDLTGYATEEYVDNAIEAIDIPTVEVDKAYVTEQMNVVYQDITKRNYVGVDYVTEKLEGYAPAEHEHEEYQTAEEVQALIDASAGSGGGGGGSVAVDNATIIQNADGTISTALGGSKVETTPATTYTSWSSSTGITTGGDGWTMTQDFFLSKKLDTSKEYTIELKLASSDEVYSTTVYYDSSQGKFILTKPLTNWGIDSFINSSTQYYKFYLTNGSNFYQIEYITNVTFKTIAEYDYVPLDANFLPINTAHLPINPSTGLIETPIGGYLKVNGESIYHATDAGSAINIERDVDKFIGLGANTLPSGIYFGATVIGQDNNLASWGGNMTMLGNTNQGNMMDSIILGMQNKSSDTNYISSANYNTVLGAKNTWKPTNSYYHTGTTIIGTENNISNMNARNSVIVGYQNSIRSSSSPMWGSPVAMFFFGQGLSNVNDSNTTQGNYHIDCAVGKYNQAPTLENLPFVVGMGTADNASNRKNGLTIDSTGSVSTLGGIDNSGADYAEYFEWVDGNPEAEDRIGYAVTLEGNKIRIANAEDDVIGFISGTAMAIGESAPWHWNGRFVKDEFGRVQFEEKEFEEHYFEKDEEGNEVVKTYMIKKVVEVQNPEWNPEEEYIPRKFRAEWDTVGLLGKLFVRDDGSCEVGGYAVVTDGGIVTAASGKTNMRVLERTSENIVRVLFK